MNGRNQLLLTFNMTAGATVFLPLFTSMIVSLVSGEENRWWSWGRAEELGQGVTLGFVYFWSLLLFGGIVWYGGNRVLQNDNKGQLKGFLVTLILFTNLALMLALLTSDLGVQVVDAAEERGWLLSMVLTFAFWIFFGAIWSLILYQKISNPKSESNSYDYQRQADSPIV